MSSANLIGSHLAIGVVAVLSCGGLLQAKEFETANPDLSLRWDNTLRYNLGFRAEGRERALANNASISCIRISAPTTVNSMTTTPGACRSVAALPATSMPRTSSSTG
ncbi:hypothetical protein [Pseudomonas aeruginosa]|uniref:hypothetical protein n=1 Tax=Pseudomonas aeruginosa TaxID=287 RepID=UPI00397E6298